MRQRYFSFAKISKVSDFVSIYFVMLMCGFYLSFSIYIKNSVVLYVFNNYTESHRVKKSCTEKTKTLLNNQSYNGMFQAFCGDCFIFNPKLIIDVIVSKV